MEEVTKFSKGVKLGLAAYIAGFISVYGIVYGVVDIAPRPIRVPTTFGSMAGECRFEFRGDELNELGACVGRECVEVYSDGREKRRSSSLTDREVNYMVAHCEQKSHLISD